MRIIDCEQRSPQWYAARRGIPTASRFKDVLATLKSGSPAQARTDYMAVLAAERLTEQLTEHFTTPDMQRGIDLEPHALAAYQRKTECDLSLLGFVLHDEIMTGCSPDALVGMSGLVQVKCPASHKQLVDHLQLKDAGPHQAQVQGEMWIMEAAWNDLVIYHPSLPVHIIRIHRDDKFIASLESSIKDFLAELDELESDLRKMLGMQREHS